MIDRGGLLVVLACGSAGVVAAAACVGPTPALGTSDGGAGAGGGDTTSSAGGHGGTGGAGGAGGNGVSSSSVGGGGGMPTLCDGDGTFEPGEICYGSVDTQSGGLRSLVLGNLNGDGSPDLLGVEQDTAYHARLNDGTGTFGSSQVLPGSAPSLPIVRGAIGRLSVDTSGGVDSFGDFVLARGQGAPSLQVWVGNGAGTALSGSAWDPGSSQCTVAVAVAELTGDMNKPDIAAVGAGANSCDGTGGRLRVFDNAGSTISPLSFTVHYDHPLTALATFVRPFDREGDGDTDLLVTTTSDNTVHVFENDGSPSPFSPQSTVVSGAMGLFEVAAGDLDGDQDQDLVAGSSGPNASNLVILRNDGNGYSEQLLPIGAPQGTVEVYDVDDDGDLDILAGNGNRITVYIGDGTGMFQGPLHLFDGSVSARFAMGDLNGDGRADFVSYDNGAATLKVILSDATARSPL